jgi:CspA family cold shock protein
MSNVFGTLTMNGTIKKLTPERGFGFIRGEDGTEYFFHRSELREGLRFDELKAGQRVSFEPRQADKGPRAAEVSPAAA